MPLLQIKDLTLSIGDTTILKDIDLTLEPGEIRGIVGESGSGKSMTAFSIMQLLPHDAKIGGSIMFDGMDLTKASEDQMCSLRGDDLAMVFQEPMTALNPLKTIGEQVAEGIRLHGNITRRSAKAQAAEILEHVGLPNAHFPLNRYPDQLSGGQRQRVLIAMACAMRPKLLIADEPTTALDVTVQAKILKLLKSLVDEYQMGLLLISHDLGVVAEVADTITILREGEIVEQGATLDVLRQQKHPYTRQLAEASSHQPLRNTKPVLSSNVGDTQPLLEIKNLTVTYPRARKHLFHRPPPLPAIDDLSFRIYPGQTTALIGESGCGKSTLARTILGLQQPHSGEILFDSTQIIPGSPEALQQARQDMQIVFQDPYGSFDPRHKVGRLVGEPLHLRPDMDKHERLAMVEQALRSVGLSTDDMDKFAHEFSGGQRQRIAIARALVTRPRLIIADEPVSALDVSIRAQILDLLSQLRDELSIAYLFISHDLSVVRAFCDEVMIMESGKILEQGPVDQVFDNPQYEFTRELLDAAPNLEKILFA
ncbi:MAG: ABC transporter ATP-binding protein [Rhizobiaceae bacterium]|nr:ABC transporter ATP-binding protein [Rhizobiaceae bacterium]